MHGNLHRLNTAEHGLVRASLFSRGYGLVLGAALSAGLNLKFATEPNGRARNVTGGVQDWSIGDLFPCTVQARGGDRLIFQARDLHDDSWEAPIRPTYAEAEEDARAYLRDLNKHGRAHARQVRNLHNSKGGIHSFADVAA